MDKLSVMDRFAISMVVIGGLNWGALGLFDADLIAITLGPRTLLTRAVYLVILQSALYVVMLVHVLRKQHLTA